MQSPKKQTRKAGASRNVAPFRPTRAEALALRSNRYFGKVCERHAEANGERYVYNCSCVRCQADQNKKRKQTPAQKARISARSRAYRARTRKHQTTRKRAYRLANQRHITFYKRAWCLANPERVAAIHHARRARKLAAPGHWTAADIEQLRIKQNGICAGPHCDTPLAVSETKDHKTPLIRGGSNWPRNLQLLCGPCNFSKCARTNAEWYKYLRLTGEQRDEIKDRHRPHHRARTRGTPAQELSAPVGSAATGTTPRQAQAARQADAATF